jgi:hypothetical protein
MNRRRFVETASVARFQGYDLLMRNLKDEMDKESKTGKDSDTQRVNEPLSDRQTGAEQNRV